MGSDWEEDDVSTHSRPKAAVQERNEAIMDDIVSTHSRPKAADPANGIFYPLFSVSTHSRPKAADQFKQFGFVQFGFQHTAARRRLINSNSWALSSSGFNTQPPEGG